ncbi:hypothetical protein [Corynebacterium caspium]|uniref:LGFP repeat-containing protein n=1 Tax=Corynebacterium caspium TaxID=234828 RepID=UPI000A037CB9
MNGFIYWHPKTGAYTVSIPASAVWANSRWERGHFGYPISSEQATPDGIGRYNRRYPAPMGIFRRHHWRCRLSHQ